MPQNKQIIVDGQVVTDDWQLITELEESGVIPSTKVIVPLSVWSNDTALKNREDIGVWINNDIDLAEIDESIINLPLIAVDFPGFMDGRGFSLARLLRERYGYKGEIRAIGHVIRDQLCYLKRCGFNAFCLRDENDLSAALASLNDFNEAYQTSVDQPLPLFRRRA
jgi:uncharacterized protein (DUF934 family)